MRQSDGTPIEILSMNREHSIRVRCSDSPATVGKVLAEEIISEIANLAPDTPYFLGLPTGRTPLPFLNAFVSQISSSSPEFQKALIHSLHIIVMDDLIDADGRNLPPEIEFGARGFMKKHLIDPLSQFCECSNLERQILFPKPGEVESLKKFVMANGGIAFQMIATDPFEGHVAQNFPNAPFRKTEAEKQLPLSSDFIRHNPWAAQYSGVTFDLVDFSDMIAANPRGKLAIVVCGDEKRDVLSRFFQNRFASESFPLSYFWEGGVPVELHADMKGIAEEVSETHPEKA